MTITSSKDLLPRALDIEPAPDESDAARGAAAQPVIFDAQAASILLSIFNVPTPPDFSAALVAHEKAMLGQAGGERASLAGTASVKFMITAQDERDLRQLGYSQEQIDKFRPQEAADILRAGAAANLPA